MPTVFEYIKQREAHFQIVYTLLAALILSVSGMQIGYSSVTLQFIKNPKTGIGLDDEMETLITSVPSITALVGCLVSVFVLRYGRRKTILMGDVSFLIGWILLASSYSTVQLLFARIILGFSMGMSMATNQIYISEILSVHLARILNPSTSFFLSFGAVIVYTLGYVINGEWRLIAMICMIFTLVASILAFLFLPESPRWLLTKGRIEDARKALLKLRGCQKATQDFELEFSEMINYSKSEYNLGRKSLRAENFISEDIAMVSKFDSKDSEPVDIDKENKHRTSIKSIWMNILELLGYFKLPEVWKPFLIINCFFFFTHFSGCVVMMTYTVNVVENASALENPFLITIIIGVCLMIGDILLISCSFWIGRRTMIMVSGIVVSSSLLTLGIYKQYFEESGVSSIPLICLFAYVILGKMGLLDLPWTLLGELFPTKFIYFVGPILACCVGIYEFLALQSYPKLIGIGFPFTVYLYSGSAIILTIILAITLPETAGRTKTEIEEAFRK